MKLLAITMALFGCGASSARDLGPALQVVGESAGLRLEDPVATTSPWFDGERVTLVGARGETLGILVQHRDAAPTSLAIDGAEVRGYAVDAFRVRRPSTSMYGGSRGVGTYVDGLTPAAQPASDPAYFEIVIPRTAASGVRNGELVVGTRRVPVVLAVAAVTLPAQSPRVWAYGDPRELAWAAGATGDPPRDVPTAAERACADVFRQRGVLLSPDMPLAWWPTRKDTLAGIRDIPVVIPKEPAAAAEAVRGWIAATRGTGQVPFSIPIDEPRTPDARERVRALAAAVRAAGGGPTTFRFAVTDQPRPEYGDLVDLYIDPHAPTNGAWTYNGTPPRAGSMVLDAAAPGPRTWGWIAFRYNVPTWYVWDALYWHDRHNRRGQPLPGRSSVGERDPVSFDEGEDHGNLDGVLALPSADGATCRPTLRLAALHRGQQDRALLELAAKCAPEATARIAETLVPRALGDAPKKGPVSWSTKDADWELARRKLLALASCE
jgi:hypothetical protein